MDRALPHPKGSRGLLENLKHGCLVRSALIWAGGPVACPAGRDITGHDAFANHSRSVRMSLDWSPTAEMGPDHVFTALLKPVVWCGLYRGKHIRSQHIKCSYGAALLLGSITMSWPQRTPHAVPGHAQNQRRSSLTPPPTPH